MYLDKILYLFVILQILIKFYMKFISIELQQVPIQNRIISILNLRACHDTCICIATVFKKIDLHAINPRISIQCVRSN